MLMVLVSSMRAQTPVEVGGIITGTTVWTNDFTYIVTDDIRVPLNATLSIEAGTKVLFQQSKGLNIEGGNLFVNGTELDTVSFLPNHTNPAQTWKWKGISISGINQIEKVVIGYACIKEAEVGIEINNSSFVLISNSCLMDNFWRGISMTNSTHCRLVDSHIKNNYVGIEILGKSATGISANNTIENNEIVESTTNILFINESSGICRNNLIRGNVVSGGINGIWLDNSGTSASYQNTISQNAIINNGGGFGYGLYLAMDSTVVSQNIFWKNDNAISFRNASSGIISQNTFYQNETCIPIGVGSKRNRIQNNTFAENEQKALSISEATGTVAYQNNFTNNLLDTSLVENLTSQNLNATGNYWGTVNTDQINQLIWDQQDDPQLGELFYMPNLTEHDTIAPISPPFQVKKQWVDGRVRLSWRPNQEADFSSYNIYFGGFTAYQFNQELRGVTDTAIYLNNLHLDDTIAVTAGDQQHMSMDKPMFLSHESAFAFAKTAAFAGTDTSICKNENIYRINNASAPGAYESLAWTSSGDGVFSDPHSLSTIYFPGEQDFARGWSRIQLVVVSADETYSDSFLLSYSDDPIAFAGNDTIIGKQMPLNLSNAFAFDADIVFWESLGDGSFDQPNIIHPTYIPGETDADLGQVELVLHVSSPCGVVSDTVSVAILDAFSMSGRVWFEGQTLDGAMVLAVNLQDNTIRFADRVQTDAHGDFVFNSLFKGNYVVFAVPDTMSGLNAVSCYYAESEHWETAHQIVLNADIFDVDINLQPKAKNMPQGTGKISGKFNLPVEPFKAQSVFCGDWFSREPAQLCNDGLSNISITLYNPGLTSSLDYTLTDANGHFSFTNLPYGLYRLHAEVPGYPMNLSPVLSLSATTPEVSNVQMKIELEKISIYLPDQDGVSEVTVRVFPNPVKETLSLNLREEGFHTLYIYDIQGRIVFTKQLTAAEEGKQQLFNINLSALKNGVYVGLLMTSGEYQRFSFVKQ